MVKLARWTMSHRRAVVVAWIAAAIGIFAVSTSVGKKTASSFTLPGTGSQHAVDLLKSHFPAQAGDADQIVFHAKSGTLLSAADRATIGTTLARVGRLPHVTGIVSPYAAGQHAISRDGTIAFATVNFDQRANALPKTAVDKVISTAESARSGSLDVQLGGQAIEQAQQASLGFATVVGIAAAIVILLISFGSFSAMGLPIATALLGLGAGVGVITLASHVIDMPDFASELALMIGLGVGVDYALFIVTRFRETYRKNGGDVEQAVEAALNTSGRAVLFAGVTVVIALLGMFALGVERPQRRGGGRRDRGSDRARSVAHTAAGAAQPDGRADRRGLGPPRTPRRTGCRAQFLAALGPPRPAAPGCDRARGDGADARARRSGARAPSGLERCGQ